MATEAGRVWVSVIPSMKDFAKRVNSSPETKKLEVKVKVIPDLTGFREEVQRRLAGQSVKVKVEAETGSFRTSLAGLRGGKVNVGVDLDLGMARAKLLAFTAGAAKLSIGTLGIGAAVNAAGQLTAALAPAVGTLAALPAFAGAGALAVGTLKTAFSGFGDAIGDDPKKAAEALAKMPPSARAAAQAVNGLKPAWTGLRLDVQQRMFDGLSGRITGLGKTYIPILRGAMAGLAGDLNGRVKDALDVLSESGNVTGITTGLGFVRTGLNSMFGALAPLTQAFTTLFIDGAPFVARFGAWVESGARAFSLFIGNASRAGQIPIWIENGIAVFQQLFAIVGNVGSILVSVFSAASASGGSFLSVVAQVTGQIAAFLRSAQGVALLQGIFGNIAVAVRALAPLFSAIGTTLVTTVLPAVSSVLPAVGAALGSLAPAIAPLGAAIASLAPVVGTLLSALAPVVTALVTGLSPVISALAPLITVLGQALGSILLAAVQALAPPLLMVAQILTATLSPVLPVLAQMFGQIAAVIGGALVQVLSAVAPLFPMLAMALVQILTALMPVIPLWGQFISGVLSALLPILPVVVQLFVSLVQALLPLLPPIFQLAQALMPVWIAALNILVPILGFLANIVGTVLVFGVRLLVSVLGFLISILSVGVGAAVAVVTGIFNGLAATFRFVGSVVSWLWVNVIQPTFSFIGMAAGFLMAVIATVLITPFVIAFRLIASVVTWLWLNVVQPAWAGISTAIRIAWTVISGVLTVAMGFLRGVFAATWNWLWNGLIVPVWNGIRAAISAAWNFILGNIFNPIVNFLRATLGPVFMWLWRNIIEPAWNGIRSVISGAWQFIQGVFNTGKAAVQAVGQAFQNVADWVGRSWASIREAARGPVKFVVDVVYNNGIRPVWNGIAGLFGMGQLPAVTMAAGGVLPGYTPGRDPHVFTSPTGGRLALSGGEGILVPEAVRALGPAFVGWANRTFSGGRSKGGAGTPQGRGFASGGITRFADGGVLDGIGSAIAGAGDFFMNVFTDPPAAVKKLFSKVIGDGARTPGRGTWTDALKRIPGKAVEGVIAKVKKWIEEMASMTGGAGGNWAPIAAQALAITGQPQSLLWRVLKQIQIESGGNPRAINLWDSNAKKGTPSKGLIQTIDPTFQRYRHPGLPNDPYHPLSNIVAGIRYAIARYGSIQAIWPKTMGYDQGGIANGTGFMAKQTIRPERVLSPRQTASFERLVPVLTSMSRSGAGSPYRAADFQSSGRGGGPFIGEVHQHLPEGASGKEFANELTFAIRSGQGGPGVNDR